MTKTIYKATLTKKGVPNLFCVASDVQETAKMLEGYLEELKEECPGYWNILNTNDEIMFTTTIKSIERLTDYVRY